MSEMFAESLELVAMLTVLFDVLHSENLLESYPSYYSPRFSTVLHGAGPTSVHLMLVLPMSCWCWSYLCPVDAVPTSVLLMLVIPLSCWCWSYLCLVDAGPTSVLLMLVLHLSCWCWSYLCPVDAGPTSVLLMLVLPLSCWCWLYLCPVDAGYTSVLLMLVIPLSCWCWLYLCPVDAGPVDAGVPCCPAWCVCVVHVENAVLVYYCYNGCVFIWWASLMLLCLSENHSEIIIFEGKSLLCCFVWGKSLWHYFVKGEITLTLLCFFCLAA